MSQSQSPQVEVRHDRSALRYELVVDGELAGHADYLLRDGVYVFHHTEVDRTWQSRGLAARLVAGALDDVGERGAQVTPSCSYVARFMATHPDYQRLRAG